MSSRTENRRSIVKRHQLFSIKHVRLSLSRTGRPPQFTPDHVEIDNAKEEALRVPPIFFSDGRRIDA